MVGTTSRVKGVRAASPPVYVRSVPEGRGGLPGDSVGQSHLALCSSWRFDRPLRFISAGRSPDPSAPRHKRQQRAAHEGQH